MEEKEKIKNLSMWGRGKKSPPYELGLRITDECNLKCLSCIQRKKGFKKGDVLPTETYLRLIKEANEMGTKKVHLLGGGEVMYRPDISIPVLRKIKKYGMYGSLVTNGTLFDEDTLSELVSNEWDYIIFSVDGPNAETHDYLRGINGAFNKTIETIQKLDYHKRKLKKQIPRISMALVLNNRNYDKLTEMIKLAKDIGANEFLIWPMVVYTQLGKKLELNEKQKIFVYREIKKLKELAENFGIAVNVTDIYGEEVIEKSSKIGKVIESKMIKSSDNNFLSVPCFFPWYHITVHVDGNCEPCPNIEGPSANTNIKEISLQDIWYGKHFNEVRASLKRGDLLPSCANCCAANLFETNLLRKKLSRVL